MDRNLGLEAVRLTEAAAIASARLLGRGDEKARSKSHTIRYIEATHHFEHKPHFAF